jgi:predicted Rossmann fold nucleotide-binding protein DprA/Smf involved in DNA uptake
MIEVCAALLGEVLPGAEPLSKRARRALRLALCEGGPEAARRVAESLPTEAERSAALLRLMRIGEASSVLECYGRRGISAVCETDDTYPVAWKKRLGWAAPPLVFLAGAAKVLNLRAVGVVGSRDTAAGSLALARRAGRVVAGMEYAVVSGSARGVDSAAMEAALAAGGCAIGIVDHSLSASAIEGQWAKALGDGRLALASPNRPDAGFTVGGAMGRNKLIYGLAEVTLVVECRAGRGGTWTGAAEALRRRWGGVLVWMGSGASSSNGALADLGATPLGDLEDLARALKGEEGAAGALFTP